MNKLLLILLDKVLPYLEENVALTARIIEIQKKIAENEKAMLELQKQQLENIALQKSVNNLGDLLAKITKQEKQINAKP